MARKDVVTVEQGDTITLNASESWKRTVELPDKGRGRTARVKVEWRRDTAELVFTVEGD